MCVHIDLLCGHTDLLIVHTDLLCVHTDLLCGHTDLLCGHTDLLCGHTDLLCDHTDLLCFHTDLLCGHTDLFLLCYCHTKMVMERKCIPDSKMKSRLWQHSIHTVLALSVMVILVQNKAHCVMRHIDQY